MGLYDREYTQYQDPPTQFGPRLRGGVSSKPMWLLLVIINVVIYLANMLFTPRDDAIMAWMSVWHGAEEGGPPDTLTTPWFWWQWLTYAFAHSPNNMMHIVFNMFGLVIFGPSVEQRLGRWEFLRFYLVAAVLGGIVHSLYCLVGGPSVMLGASGSVMAVVILYCFFYPNATILLMMVFPVKAWVAGLMFAGYDLVQALSSSGGNTAVDVHLAGMAFAALYYTGGLKLDVLNPARFAKGGVGLPKRGPNLKVHDPDKKLRKEAAEADRILQKIHDQGEASLTGAERRILEKYSRRMRKRN